MIDYKILKSDLMRDEGIRLKAYKCPAGKLTIGIGRNIDPAGGKGITTKEADILLSNDIDECIEDLKKIFPKFASLPDNMQRVLVNMRFNLGPEKFRQFGRLIAGVEHKEPEIVIKSMKESLWHRQVGDRADRLVRLIEELL